MTSKSNKEKAYKIFTIRDIDVAKVSEKGMIPTKSVDMETFQRVIDIIVKDQKKISAYWEQVNKNVMDTAERSLKSEAVIETLINTFIVIIKILANKGVVSKEEFSAVYSNIIGVPPEKGLVKVYFGD